MKRNKKVCSVDKANVLETSRVWRETMHRIKDEYPEVEYTDMYVDNCAMQLVRNPGQFDVIVTGNLFGDILSDEASMITGFIFFITLIITLLVEGIGAEAIGHFLSGKPIVGVFLAGVVGLIPNCAASVSITQLYLMGILNAGQMMAGLLVGAGVGLLVLFRTNDHPNENLRITIMLYGLGVFWGLVIEYLGIVF